MFDTILTVTNSSKKLFWIFIGSNVTDKKLKNCILIEKFLVKLKIEENLLQKLFIYERYLFIDDWRSHTYIVGLNTKDNKFKIQ